MSATGRRESLLPIELRILAFTRPSLGIDGG